MDGAAWPRVGQKRMTTYGGCSGNMIRPIALKMVSSIANKFPGFPILATGGADSADSTIQFLYAGAGVMQVSSAIQNQDFTIVQDWIMGLKWHLYAQSRSDLASWEKQLPPLDETKSLQTGCPPRFGKYVKHHHTAKTERERVRKTDPATIKHGPVPTVNSLIGRSLQTIGSFGDLLSQYPRNQVIAVVNDDLCINCGKCMMTCNDTGYQAIRFSGDTHQPFITDSCTGCTLCVSVCPVPDCITMVERNTRTRPEHPDYNPSRGIPMGQEQLPVGAKVKLAL